MIIQKRDLYLSTDINICNLQTPKTINDATFYLEILGMSRITFICKIKLYKKSLFKIIYIYERQFMRINIEMVESKLKSEKYLPFERVTRGRVVISCGGQ